MKIAPGFIAKATVQNVFLVGFITKSLDSLFINRKSEKDRHDIAQQLMNRQSDFLEGRIHTPLMVFPEGTVTSGRHLLPFKKGAFLSKMPIKPFLVKIPDDKFSIAFGALYLYQHVILIMCFFYHSLTFYELPVIRPTDYMFETYKAYGKENWEIYSEVVRMMYKEIGGFQLSQKTFKDSLDYTSYINGTLITNT